MGNRREDIHKERLGAYGLKLSDGTVDVLQQLCRVNRHLYGWTMSQTVADLASRALTERLKADPSLAIIATKPRQASPRKSLPPPPRVRSGNDWS